MTTSAAASASVPNADTEIADLPPAAGGSSAPPGPRWRRWTAGTLAVVTAFLLVLSMVAGWSTRTVLTTDRFVAQVGPVIEQPAVQQVVSDEISKEIVTYADIQGRLSERLPANLQVLAPVVESQVSGYVNRTIAKLVASDQFATLWEQALRLSHEEVIKTLTGSSAAVQIVKGKIVIDVTPMIVEVLRNLQQQAPELFLKGAVINRIPADADLSKVRALASKYLGVELPADFGQIAVADSGNLEVAQTGYRVISVSVWLLLALTVACFVVALLVSVTRRRTLLQIAVWTAFLTLLVTVVLRVISKQTIAGIADANYRLAVQEGLSVVFTRLRLLGTILFWVSLVVAAVCYLLGPGRYAVWFRGLFQGAGGAGSGFVGRHLDPLRVGGALLALLVVFVWPSWVMLVVVLLVLAAYEALVTYVARDASAAAPPAEEPSLSSQ